MRANIVLLLLFLTAALLPMGAEEKPSSAPAAVAASETGARAGQPARNAGSAGASLDVPPGPELTAVESRQLDRISDLYTELAQQIAETQARLKVLSEMHQKLAADFQTFQANVIAARGYKAGQATLDVQMRKVMPVPAKPEVSSR